MVEFPINNVRNKFEFPAGIQKDTVSETVQVGLVFVRFPVIPANRCIVENVDPVYDDFLPEVEDHFVPYNNSARHRTDL
jgi:hypothetical protein